MTRNDGNRRIEQGRLVYYSQKADSAYWDSHWQDNLDSNFYNRYLRGFLDYFEIPFTRHLDRNGVTLEAGCGTGQWVIALRQRGYNCIGIDYATRTLNHAKKISDAPYLCGDIMALGLGNGTCDSVISLGVVEHRQAGPEPFIIEMNRILKPGGKLLISIPYFNQLRLWRAQHGAYQDAIANLHFYQQAFTKEEFKKILTDAGFKILEYYPYEHRKCLRQELPWITRIGSFTSRVLQKLSDYIPYVNSQLGHMLLVVAEKQA